MIFIPHSIESRGHHEKSPAVRNSILTAGLFWVSEGKFTLARNLPISLMVALAIIPKYCFAFLPLPRRQSSKC